MNGNFDKKRHNNDARKGVETYLLMPAKLILILYVMSMERKTQKLW
jgi:hypothetical protein